MAPSYLAQITASMAKTVYLEVTYATYDEQKTPPGGGNSGPVAGGVIGGLLGIGAIVAAVFLVRRRTLLKRPMNEAKQLVKRPSIDVTCHEYQNINLIQDSNIGKRHPPPPLPEPDIALDTIDSQHNDEFDDTNENPYLNTQDIINDLKKITISELFSYVKSRPVKEFLDEYEDFPKGMLPSIPCVAASRPENVSLNRYQGIYPYDHSRVVITGQPDFFINASYINGFSRGKAYIASLGPTVKHTHGFKTFWNMVWNEDTDVIVMLTNLQEPSGMKCEKYWADNGTKRVIGEFTIQSMSEEVAAEYTVRTFSVYKDSKSRVVTQLHYTAWPDKKVPEDVTSLIEFRQRVKASPTSSLGTLVVHCSAGIGRTGTYIALDRLIEEGKTTNSINVYDCVMNMRNQRVNMVQTPDQYVYLHQALVYCLVFDVEPITADEIDEYIQTTSNNVFSKLFQQLQQSVEEESIENKEARARNGDLVERNRRRADIPGDTHRIRLFIDKEMGETDYINAVYLNSFKRLEHFILAQSPLPATVDDFVAMLYQENCCCIVALDDHLKTGTNNAVYLPPENQSVSYGNFTISFKQLDSKPAYSVRKLKIGHSGRFEEGEKVAYHFEFNGWKHDEGVPNDAPIFVDLIKEVGEYATLLEDKNSHVLVHCMTGSERSGLFCAVSNLIEKMGQERQVSVVNTLRQVRARRKSAIPNMDQLKFCYQAVNTFVKKKN